MMSLGHRRASMAVVLYFPTPAISFKHPSSPQLSFPVPLSQSSPANPAFTPPFLQLASQLTHLSSSSQSLLFPTSAEHSAKHTAPGLHIQFVLLPQFCHLDIGFAVLFHPRASLPGEKFSDHLEQEMRWGREPRVRTTLSSCSISLLCTGQKAHALHRQQSWEMLL